MSFPCLDKVEARSQTLRDAPPEPHYIIPSKYQLFHSKEPFFLDYGGYLPGYSIAYEMWGKLNSAKSNIILLHTGLSASSHAKSTAQNPSPGWWEEFIGPGNYLDTEKYLIICTNVIGGCYGSTGPSSLDPKDGKPYATRFPIVSVNDMVRAQHNLIKEVFGTENIYASVGSSMGGMQSLAYGYEFPDKVSKIVSISGCARSHPYAIAMRHCQRQVLMADPNWQRGFYYGTNQPPHMGMKLSREIGTITYRSGPEWEMRFGTERADPSRVPALCPDFLIETYLDHQGEKFCLQYDANSMLYVSKAMDLFDLSHSNRSKAEKVRTRSEQCYYNDPDNFSGNPLCSLPDDPIKEKQGRGKVRSSEESLDDLVQGMSKLAHKDVLVIGAESDILFPVKQQLEVAETLKMGAQRRGLEGGNINSFILSEETSIYGHDTFLLRVDDVGKPVRDFLA